MKLYIWRWGIADNGNPIYNWATEQCRENIPNTACMFWLNPEDKSEWEDMDQIERGEYISLLYEEHVR